MTRPTLTTSEPRPLARWRTAARGARPFLLAAVVLVAAPPASAISVFLNGVNIDGVTSQTFENCTVELDARGNVHIQAKGYMVQVQAPASPPPVSASPVATPAPVPAPSPAIPPGQVGRRYWVVTESRFPGMVQYEVDLFINSVWVKKLADDEDAQVFEVTRYLRPGRNVLHFTATKTAGATRRSHNPSHHFKVIFGEGSVGGDNVMIDNPLLEYRRHAGENQLFNDDYVVNAR